VRAMHSYDYAVVRIVPSVEREEFANAGVVLQCAERAYLDCRVHADEARLRALWPGLNFDVIRQHLEAFPRICAGDADAGPIAKLSRANAFSGWWRRAARLCKCRRYTAACANGLKKRWRKYSAGWFWLDGRGERRGGTSGPAEATGPDRFGAGASAVRGGFVVGGDRGEAGARARGLLGGRDRAVLFAAGGGGDLAESADAAGGRAVPMGQAGLRGSGRLSNGVNLWMYALVVAGSIIFVVPTDLAYMIGPAARGFRRARRGRCC